MENILEVNKDNKVFILGKNEKQHFKAYYGRPHFEWPEDFGQIEIKQGEYRKKIPLKYALKRFYEIVNTSDNIEYNFKADSKYSNVE